VSTPWATMEPCTVDIAEWGPGESVVGGGLDGTGALEAERLKHAGGIIDE